MAAEANLSHPVGAPIIAASSVRRAVHSGTAGVSPVKRGRPSKVPTVLTDAAGCRRDPRWRVYKAWPAAKQPHQERMSRACKVVGGAHKVVCHGVLTGRCCAPRHGWAFRR